MGLYLKTLRRQRVNPLGAAVNIERPLTVPAKEVVVVGTAGKLVPDGPPRDLNGAQPPFLHQPPHVPVHSSNSERVGESLPFLNDLLRRERAP